MADDKENDVTVEYGARINEASFKSVEAEIEAINERLRAETAAEHAAMPKDTREGREAERKAVNEARLRQATEELDAESGEKILKAKLALEEKERRERAAIYNQMRKDDDLNLLRRVQAHRAAVEQEEADVKKLAAAEAALQKALTKEYDKELLDRARAMRVAAEDELAETKKRVAASDLALKEQILQVNRQRAERAAILKAMTQDEDRELLRRVHDHRVAVEEEERIDAQHAKLSVAGLAREEEKAKRKLMPGVGGGRIKPPSGLTEAEEETERLAKGGSRASTFAVRRAIVEGGTVAGSGELGTIGSMAAYGPAFAAFGVILGTVALSLYAIHRAMEDTKAETQMRFAIHTLGESYDIARGRVDSFRQSTLNSRAEAASLATAYADLDAAGLKTKPGDIDNLNKLQIASGMEAKEFAAKISAMKKGDSGVFEELTGRKATIVQDEYARSLGRLPSTLTEVEKAQALLNAAILAGADASELAARNMKSLDSNWKTFKNTVTEFAGDWGMALIGRFGSGDTAQASKDRTLRDMNATPAQTLTKAEFDARIVQQQKDTVAWAAKVEAQKPGYVGELTQSILGGLLGVASNNYIGGPENVAARTTRGMSAYGDHSVFADLFGLSSEGPGLAPQLPKAPVVTTEVQKRDQALVERYDKIVTDQDAIARSYERALHGATKAEQYQSAIKIQDDYRLATSGLDQDNDKIRAITRKNEELPRTFEDEAVEKVKSLRDEIRKSLGELAGLTLAGEHNPYVKLFADAEDAARKAQERFRAFGPEAVQQFTKLYEAEANAHIFQQQITDDMTAMSLEFEAAKLSKPFIELTGEMKRTLDVFRTELQSETVLYAAQAKLIHYSMQTGGRTIEGRGRVEGIGMDPKTGLPMVAPDYLAGQEFTRLNDLKAKYAGTPGAGGEDIVHGINTQMIRLFGSLTPSAKKEVYKDSRYSSVFEGAFQGESDYDDIKRVRAEKRARQSQDMVDEATAKVRELERLGKLPEGQGAAQKDALRASVLATTGQLSQEELTPELRKARVNALREEAIHVRESQLVAKEHLQVAKNLQGWFETKAPELLAAIAAHDQATIVRIIDEAQRAKVSTLGPAMDSKAPKPTTVKLNLADNMLMNS